MITVRIFSFKEIVEEKFFKDTDDDKALAWAEEATSGYLEEEVQVWWRGRCVWWNEREV